ncbi:MAG: hypothetical protein IJQ82_02515 [Selenomonadaceae bacterium]|nr:hypothetical protein [Selenomonadaceae bacterium]
MIHRFTDEPTVCRIWNRRLRRRLIVTWSHDGTEHGIYDLNGNDSNFKLTSTRRFFTRIAFPYSLGDKGYWRSLV